MGKIYPGTVVSLLESRVGNQESMFSYSAQSVGLNPEGMSEPVTAGPSLPLSISQSKLGLCSMTACRSYKMSVIHQSCIFTWQSHCLLVSQILSCSSLSSLICCVNCCSRCRVNPCLSLVYSICIWANMVTGSCCFPC